MMSYRITPPGSPPVALVPRLHCTPTWPLPGSTSVTTGASGTVKRLSAGEVLAVLLVGVASCVVVVAVAELPSGTVPFRRVALFRAAVNRTIALAPFARGAAPDTTSIAVPFAYAVPGVQRDPLQYLMFEMFEVSKFPLGKGSETLTACASDGPVF